MPPWNFILQFLDLSTGQNTAPQCVRFSLPGLPRPCRVLVVACDSISFGQALAAHADIERQLRTNSGTLAHICGGPGMWECMTWREKSCQQILIPVIGQTLGPAGLKMIADWQSKAGTFSIILPALLPKLSHSAVFANCPQNISRLNSAAWAGNPQRLASIVMQYATQPARPGLFLSYRRSETGPLANQLFDSLGRRGYRVFVDRFCGTPGRYFPNELAEEMADKAVLVVLESPQILASKWTLWEIAFAHRYRLGLVSLKIPGAPQLRRISARKDVYPNATGELAPVDLEASIDFIQREHASAQLRRRVFYETLVAAAAASKRGSVLDAGNGMLELDSSTGQPAALLLPSGRPGNLSDVRLLGTATQFHSTRLLVGQHEHLQLSTKEDIKWLARHMNIDLAGRYDSYQRIQNLC